ncbi:MFS transporter [Corynebacterium doosanense]|uniref:MFS transporter n=1 Tax=Corynebacterium doosanense CAU 212 = DSM 45436 TaxID=558173 RepID=A0A097IEQ2_9CORY|nr:MFS transporter [Corynebacterium doosanense]AIT60622.1 MFS transporter [Corynebacterium doosanense CAU 212 = DSM 45436]
MNPPQPHETRNGRLFVLANGLQGVGDEFVSAKTVLPWILSSAGVPAFFSALLVPVRESGSMLPQAALASWVVTRRSRKRVWIIGALGQAAAAAAIAVSALLLRGVALGAAVIVALTVLALFRALASIASKDVQGRTISKGHRGRIQGRATALTGGVALAAGLGLSMVSDLPQWARAALLFTGAGAWAVGAASFTGIVEPESATTEQDSSWWSETWSLFTDDAPFRRFVLVRSLMLVSALSTSFIVLLSQELGHDLTGLGLFVVASAAASLVGGQISGIWSDRSSKQVMSVGAAVASLVIVAVVALAPSVPWTLPLGFFLIQLAHTAIRVARKTYVVDMAEDDQRTRYTGAANTFMGMILLVTGVISGAIASFGASAALIFLAAVGFAGVLGASRLPEVSARQ